MASLSSRLAPLIAALTLAFASGCDDGTPTSSNGSDGGDPNRRADSLWSLLPILDTLTLAAPGTIRITIDSGGGASHGLVHEKASSAWVLPNGTVTISTYGREPFEFHLWFPFSEPREFITPHSRADRASEPVGAAMDYDEDGVWQQHVEGLGAVLRITSVDTADDLLSGRFVVRMGWPRLGTRFESFTTYAVASGSFTDLPFQYQPSMEATVVDSIWSRSWECTASDPPRISIEGSRVTMRNYINAPGQINVLLTQQWTNGVEHGARDVECDSTTMTIRESSMPSFGPLRAVPGDPYNFIVIDEIDRVRRSIAGRFRFRMLGPGGEVYLVDDGVFRHVTY